MRIAKRWMLLVATVASGATVTDLRAQETSLVLLGYRTTVPANWTAVPAASAMRLAQFSVRLPTSGANTADAASVVVYFFGKDQGGTVESNTSRWRSQFSMPDKSRPYEKSWRDSTGSFPITFVELRGTYARGIGAGSSAEEAKSGQSLLAGIAETQNGTLFIQLFGTTETVSAESRAFTGFVSQLAHVPSRGKSE